MRAAIVLVAVCLYLISFNLYLWNLPNPDIYKSYKLLWYSYMTGGILLFYTIDGWWGYKCPEHEISAKFLLITVITNFALIAAVHHGFIINPFLQIGFFNAVWLIITVMVLYSCWKNGVFKN